jgi:hypothetical protein
MPAAITAKRRTNWTGPTRSVRSVPWRSIWLDLRRRPGTAKANKRVQFGYGLNYLIDVEHAIIVDEATPARTYD